MRAELKFDLPSENPEFEKSLYGCQTFQAIQSVKTKLAHILDKKDVPDQKRQVYAEINNMLIEEIMANSIGHLFS